MQCGGCSVQDVNQVAQVLMNPATWLLVGAAWLALSSGIKKKKEERK